MSDPQPPGAPPPAPVVSVVAKPAGPRCNLACTYCFYRDKEKLYPDRAHHTMTGEVLESFIRQTLITHPLPTVGFCWQGGEPTLAGLEFFQEVIRLQDKHRNGKVIENALQTNGVGLDDRWCAFLADHGFLVGLSVDGPRALHDRLRVDPAGRGTFQRVLRAIDCLKRHGVSFNTITAVHAGNVDHPLEVYHFLRQASEGHMQLIPIVERSLLEPANDEELKLLPPTDSNPARVTPWSVEPRRFGEFLCALFDEWVRHDVGRCFIQTFDTALEAWMGMEPSLCVFARTCGRAMVIEHDGSLFPCDHYVYPQYRLGSILERPLASLTGAEPQRRFGAQKLEALSRYCRDCEVRFVCNGDCPKHRFATAPDGEAGLSYLCPGYKAFFRHIDPYMRFMANELRHRRAPANVMAWATGAAGRRGGGRRAARSGGAGQRGHGARNG